MSVEERFWKVGASLLFAHDALGSQGVVDHLEVAVLSCARSGASLFRRSLFCFQNYRFLEASTRQEIDRSVSLFGIHAFTFKPIDLQ